MAATEVPSVMVNLKAPNQYNYEHWSFRVKTYLLAEDLWDLIESTDKPPQPEDRDWWKKNAKALHAIHISCGDDSESSISGIETARESWNKLAEKFQPSELKKLAGEFLNPEANSEVVPNDDNDGDADLVEEANSEVVPNDDNDGDADLVEVEYGDKTYASFFDDVLAGRWEAVKRFIRQHPEAVRVTKSGVTALSNAVMDEDVVGVKELLPFIKETDFKILEDALSMVFTDRLKEDTEVNTEIIRCIIQKNNKLAVRRLTFFKPFTLIPLSLALHFDKPKMVSYLYSVTPLEILAGREGVFILSESLKQKRLEKSLELLRKIPSLGIARDHLGEYPLYQLANMHADAGLFLDDSQLGIWERLICRCIHIPPAPNTRYVSISVEKGENDQGENDQGNQKHLIRKGIDRIYKMKLFRHQALEILKLMCEHKSPKALDMQQKLVEKALFKAIERGHAPFISCILDSDKSFCLSTNDDKKTILHFAAEHCQYNIFDLIYGKIKKELRKDIVGMQDKFGDNTLHAVGKLSQLTQIDNIRGAALQMQKELQWFKKVERMARSKDRDCRNSDGRTPREVFTMSHRNLVKEGEKSMKETATSSSALVGALIITIMFAAAVTVPGGVKGETGVPIYLYTKAFRIFIVADIISLCFSTTSVMIFLGILTSRFAEEDFLTSLPTKLIFGFLTLFLSIGAMMIAFSSAIIIMLPEKPSIVIPSIALASIPIVSFLWMQSPFLHEIIISTYFST